MDDAKKLIRLPFLTFMYNNPRQVAVVRTIATSSRFASVERDMVTRRTDRLLKSQPPHWARATSHTLTVSVSSSLVPYSVPSKKGTEQPSYTNMSRLPGGIDSEVPHEQDEEISLCLETLTVDIGEPLAMQQHTNGEARSDVQEAEIVPDRSILIADSEDDVRLPDKEDSRYHPELTGMEGVQQEYDLGCSAEMIVYHTDQKSKVTTRAHELEELRRRNLASQNGEPRVTQQCTLSRVLTIVSSLSLDPFQP